MLLLLQQLVRFPSLASKGDVGKSVNISTNSTLADLYGLINDRYGEQAA